MRILFLTRCLPYPCGTGIQQRGFRHLKALAQMGTVDTVVLSEDKRDAPESYMPARMISRSFKIGPTSQLFETQKQDYLRERSSVRRLKLLLTTMHPHTMRPLGPSEVLNAIESVPEKFYDLVFCFRIASASWLMTIAPVAGLQYGNLVIDFDDIESHWHHHIYERERENLSPAWRLHRLRDVLLMRRLENRLLRSGWPVLCCSDTDAQVLRSRVPSALVRVVPNSVEVAAQPLQPAPHDGFVVLFVGALHYEPNRDGLQFFVEEVWPRVRRQLGEDAQLRIVGRNPTPEVMALDGRDGIQVVGPVPAMAPEYALADVCVAPIRFGSGTRIKILEAFAQFRPVVSTTQGAAGIDATDGNEILIADQGDRFADAIVTLQRDPARRERIASAAYGFVRARYAEDVVASQLHDIVLQTLKRTTRDAPSAAERT